jgi:phosphatidylglycerol:prolipoprotein diacylglycerol transferase
LAAAVYVLVFLVLVPVLHAAFGFALDELVSNPFDGLGSVLGLPGAILVAVGLLVMLLTVVQLWTQGKGFPISALPPRKLVIGGIYQTSRHPIYFGASAVFLGAGLLVRSFWVTVLCWPLFTLFFACYAVAIEEPVLLKRYGNEYRRYRDMVPLFFPFVTIRWFRVLAARFLGWVTDLVNRPAIFQTQGRGHIFFLGYGIWCGVGVALGLILFKSLLVWGGLRGLESDIMVVMATGAGLIGTRVAGIISVMFSLRLSVKDAVSRVRFVSWGGLAGFTLASIPFSYFTGKSIYTWLDASFVSLMVTHFFGRIGCMFYGCCYGKKAQTNICLTYRHPQLKASRDGKLQGEPLVPSQIYSSLYGGLIAVISLVIWASCEVPVGLPASLVCVLYGLFRFNEEWFRHQTKSPFGRLSTAQVISILLVLIGTFNLIWGLRDTAEFYPRLWGLHSAFSLNATGFCLPLLLGLITVLIFSYHRFEIGRWTKDA